MYVRREDSDYKLMHDDFGNWFEIRVARIDTTGWAQHKGDLIIEGRHIGVIDNIVMIDGAIHIKDSTDIIVGDNILFLQPPKKGVSSECPIPPESQHHNGKEKNL